MLLSEERRSRYRELQQALDEIKITVSQNNLDGAAVAAKYRKVQQFFANQIMAASSELDLQETPPEQPYLTEIHKQLRLLGTDVTFLQASRQPATAAARQTAAIARLDTLIAYCSALLQKNFDASEASQVQN
ncbi:MAG: heterocyst frequency control protein PatD [Richelia sp. CSU_2_1]|nr:heterocyst frequency control protein PatD [Richelia sp. CSU_2_1]